MYQKNAVAVAVATTERYVSRAVRKPEDGSAGGGVDLERLSTWTTTGASSRPGDEITRRPATAGYTRIRAEPSGRRKTNEHGRRVAHMSSARLIASNRHRSKDRRTCVVPRYSDNDRVSVRNVVLFSPRSCTHCSRAIDARPFSNERCSRAVVIVLRCRRRCAVVAVRHLRRNATTTR